MAVTSPRASSKGFPGAPLWWSDVQEWCKKIAEIVNSLRDGKVNSGGSITLTANTTTTTISDKRIGSTTSVKLTPTTANAATALTTTYQTYPNASEGALVINHANNAQTDRTFAYTLLG